MATKMLQPRREVWEYGALPVSVLCPFLDSSSLLLAHSKLLGRSAAGEGGDRECQRGVAAAAAWGARGMRACGHGADSDAHSRT
jgi:hypothetical protein